MIVIHSSRSSSMIEHIYAAAVCTSRSSSFTRSLFVASGLSRYTARQAISVRSRTQTGRTYNDVRRAARCTSYRADCPLCACSRRTRTRLVGPSSRCRHLCRANQSASKATTGKLLLLPCRRLRERCICRALCVTGPGSSLRAARRVLDLARTIQLGITTWWLVEPDEVGSTTCPN